MVYLFHVGLLVKFDPYWYDYNIVSDDFHQFGVVKVLPNKYDIGTITHVYNDVDDAINYATQMRQSELDARNLGK